MSDGKKNFDVKEFTHNFLRKGYWQLRALIARVVGTRFFENQWADRGLSEVEQGFSNINHPHRGWLIEQLSDLSSFSSVLEFGCGYGPNLQLIAKNFPDVEVVGIDINPFSVSEGNNQLKMCGYEKASIIEGKDNQLKQFADNSFDIIITDATLLYIGPDKIKQIISEMKRVASKALIFVELHQTGATNDPLGLGVYTQDGWVRDYQKLLNHFFADRNIKIIKIPADLWTAGAWPRLGYLIKAEI